MQIRYHKHLIQKNRSTGQKHYLAVLLNPQTNRQRTLRRRLRNATLAEIYGCAVAARFNRCTPA
jgi:hypothetical protein